MAIEQLSEQGLHYMKALQNSFETPRLLQKLPQEYIFELPHPETPIVSQNDAELQAMIRGGGFGAYNEVKDREGQEVADSIVIFERTYLRKE